MSYYYIRIFKNFQENIFNKLFDTKYFLTYHKDKAKKKGIYYENKSINNNNFTCKLGCKHPTFNKIQIWRQKRCRNF